MEDTKNTENKNLVIKNFLRNRFFEHIRRMHSDNPTLYQIILETLARFGGKRAGVEEEIVTTILQLLQKDAFAQLLFYVLFSSYKNRLIVDELKKVLLLDFLLGLSSLNTKRLCNDLLLFLLATLSDSTKKSLNVFFIQKEPLLSFLDKCEEVLTLQHGHLRKIWTKTLIPINELVSLDTQKAAKIIMVSAGNLKKQFYLVFQRHRLQRKQKTILKGKPIDESFFLNSQKYEKLKESLLKINNIGKVFIKDRMLALIALVQEKKLQEREFVVNFNRLVVILDQSDFENEWNYILHNPIVEKTLETVKKRENLFLANKQKLKRFLNRYRKLTKIKSFISKLKISLFKLFICAKTKNRNLHLFTFLNEEQVYFLGQLYKETPFPNLIEVIKVAKPNVKSLKALTLVLFNRVINLEKQLDRLRFS